MNGLFSRGSFANRCKRQRGFNQLLAIRYGHYVRFFVLGFFSAGRRVFAVNGNFATACGKISKLVVPTVFAFLFGFGRIWHRDGFSAAIRRRIALCKIMGCSVRGWQQLRRNLAAAAFFSAIRSPCWVVRIILGQLSGTGEPGSGWDLALHRLAS
jgi:hypothetical protein